MSGQELFDVRKRLGWTQARMARHLGYSVNYLAQCERGERSITPRAERNVLVLDTVRTLCRLLSFDVT